MMVTAVGMSLVQANAKVGNATDSGVQNQIIANDAQTTDALADKIKALQAGINPVESVEIVEVTSNKVAPQDDGDIYRLIDDIESKATIVTLQNDKLSAYEADLQVEQLVQENTKAKSKAKAKRFVPSRLPVAGSGQLSRSAAPAIAAKRASRAAHAKSRGLCAKYVRKALQGAGYKFTPNPSAYQYATRGTLRKAGFTKISNRSKPQIGDVVVVSRSRAHPHGHISIYDGRNWVSDFRQRKANPYSRPYPYTTWRDSRYLNNNGAQGLYMANR